jgi:hypothetical protein
VGKTPTNTISSAIREEVVKRFEDVVTNEIRSHNLAILKYQSDLKEVNISFQNIIEKQEHLKYETEKIYLKSQEDFLSEIKRIESDFSTQKKYIYDSRVILEEELQNFDKRLSDSIDVKEFEEFKCDINIRFSLFEKKLEAETKKVNEHIESVILYISKAVEHLKNINEKHENKLDNDLDVLSKTVDTYKVDAQGVKREMNVLNKGLFIAEKKLEHIYGLLKRNKEGGELCRKPD